MLTFESPEGATPLDPDEIEGLSLTHITTRGELDRWEQENILDAIRWIDKTKPKDILNELFMKNLHKRMFRNVWIWAGSFRHSDKNIGVPWFQISTSLAGLCENTKVWIELKDDSQDVIAARFHHQLVSIHPFSNGNGRHARLMTDILLKNILGVSQFTWGSSNLSATSETRKAYINALHDADMGRYHALLEFARS